MPEGKRDISAIRTFRDKLNAGRPPDEAKVALQAKLNETFEFTRIGNGPTATGSSSGWRMNGSLYFKCIGCGYMMCNDTNDYDQCFCGAMSIDSDAGRFGSDYGDDEIEVYRAEVKAII